MNKTWDFSALKVLNDHYSLPGYDFYLLLTDSPFFFWDTITYCHLIVNILICIYRVPTAFNMPMSAVINIHN